MANNNNNNQAVDNENRNVVDKIFNYKFFESTSSGIVLVRRNAFTGKIYSINKSGIHFSWFPWVGQKLYTTDPQRLNTPPASAYTADSDGSKIDYDTDYIYHVVDPAKLASAQYNNERVNNSGETTFQIIGEKLDNIVRSYVQRQRLEDIVGKGDIDITNEPLSKSKLDEIKDEFGVQLDDVTITNIKLPKSITDQMEKNRVAELSKKEAEAKVEADKTKAQGDAEVTRIKADSTNYERKQRLQGMKDVFVNMEPEQVQAFLNSENVQAVASHPNANFFVNIGGNNQNLNAIKQGAMFQSGMNSINGNQNNKYTPVNVENEATQDYSSYDNVDDYIKDQDKDFNRHVR